MQKPTCDAHFKTHFINEKFEGISYNADHFLTWLGWLQNELLQGWIPCCPQNCTGTEELTRSADMWRLWSCRLLHQVAHLSPTKKEEDKNKTLQQRMLGCGVAGVGDIGEVVRLITEIANGYWHDFECSTHAQIVHLLRSDMFTDVIWT